MRVQYVAAVVAEEKDRTTVAGWSRGEDEDELAGWLWLRLVRSRLRLRSRLKAQGCGKFTWCSDTVVLDDISNRVGWFQQAKPKGCSPRWPDLLGIPLGV